MSEVTYSLHLISILKQVTADSKLCNFNCRSSITFQQDKKSKTQTFSVQQINSNKIGQTQLNVNFHFTGVLNKRRHRSFVILEIHFTPINIKIGHVNAPAHYRTKSIQILLELRPQLH